MLRFSLSVVGFYRSKAYNKKKIINNLAVKKYNREHSFDHPS